MLGAFRFLLVAVECGTWGCPGPDGFVVVAVAAAAAAAAVVAVAVAVAAAAAAAVGFDSGAAVAWVVYGKPALLAPESYSEPSPCYPRRVASFSPLRRFEADSSLRPHGGPGGRGGGGSAVAAVVGVVPVRAVSSQGCDACKMYDFLTGSLRLLDLPLRCSPSPTTPFGCLGPPSPSPSWHGLFLYLFGVRPCTRSASCDLGSRRCGPSAFP